MPEIDIHVDNCGGQNNNNAMIHFLNMIKKGGFFGAANFHFFIKSHTKNDLDCTFNSLKVLYRKQHVYTFEKCYKFFNTSKNVEVIQMFHEKVFDLESSRDDIYDIPDPKTVNINNLF